MTAGTPHDHATYIEGCFRCDLSREETREADTTRPSSHV